MKSLKTLLYSAALTTVATTGLLFVNQSQASAATTYTVANGDTLSTIAQKFNGSTDLVNQIATTNNIADINMIFVGEQLTIDADQVATTPAQTTAPVVTQQVAAPVQTPAPVVQAQPAVQAAPVQQAPVVAQTTTTTSSSKEWIAQKESGGSYSARNGQLIGRYQLSASYLNGDYSAANQDRVADQYVTSRYGSWDVAKSFWLSNGWY
ncbi:LysM peptidoglycan-binding domain-containing protein [Latilactobacillus curvatus]|uniref:aggregation-promoting factor n=1 Tax=Latilactobacillus curvatus TaxID=28038 RepID=UPI000975E6A6|nr:LysM peptidoglycan-binding domain-containing protein [Latilactobacillus curvatus]MDG2977432.1 LysM peptidoglycan-binding domain-containing protein [Latilactobacillus curvatus]